MPPSASPLHNLSFSCLPPFPSIRCTSGTTLHFTEPFRPTLSHSLPHTLPSITPSHSLALVSCAPPSSTRYSCLPCKIHLDKSVPFVEPPAASLGCHASDGPLLLALRCKIAMQCAGWYALPARKLVGHPHLSPGPHGCLNAALLTVWLHPLGAASATKLKERRPDCPHVIPQQDSAGLHLSLTAPMSWICRTKVCLSWQRLYHSNHPPLRETRLTPLRLNVTNKMY